MKLRVFYAVFLPSIAADLFQRLDFEFVLAKKGNLPIFFDICVASCLSLLTGILSIIFAAKVVIVGML